MLCRRCHTDNADASRYCSKCGGLLTRPPAVSRPRWPWYAVVALSLGFLAGGFFLATFVFRSVHPGQTRSAGTPGAPAPNQPFREPVLIPGGVSVRDLAGNEISRWGVSYFNRDWIALPVWALFGGRSLGLIVEGPDPVSVEPAYWRAGNPVVLCRIGKELEENSLALSRWQQPLPLRWQSVESNAAPLMLNAVQPDGEGPAPSFPLPEGISGAGVFIQEGRIVGWTFGPGTDTGYLWAGPEGANLVPNIRAGQFLGTVLPQCRESRFQAALALEGRVPAVEGLRAYADGFRFPPLLAVKDTPPPLRAPAIARRMQLESTQLIQRGSGADVARILDDEVLIAASDPELVKATILARVQTRGYESAIRDLAALEKKSSKSAGAPFTGLESVRLQLYKEWLAGFIEKGSYYGGSEAFEKARREFPDDLDIHLMGVEIAVIERQFARAAELLQTKSYPPALTDRAKSLESQVQEAQKDDGVVLTRFNPGADHIPVDGYINGRYPQKFLIDTGANICTIPTEAVSALGIKIDDSTPVVSVRGIAGYSVSYEVTLESIEISRQRVFGLKAIVIDMPDYPGYGLLGTSFLNNFQMEIDSKKGILRLKKK